MSPNPWIHLSQPNPQAALRLFCFAHAGGGSLPYRNWPDTLPTQMEVCAIRLPGRESRFREAPFRRMQDLIPALGAAIEDELDRPFVFFGHSMGALVAFELSRHLQKTHGRWPAILFVSGRRAPHLSEPGPPLHTMPQEQFYAALQSRYNAVPLAVQQSPDLLELMLPVLQADFALIESYQYQAGPPLPCPISAFGGQDDSRIGLADLQGWDQHTAGTFSVRILAGDHFYFNQDPTPLHLTMTTDLIRAGLVA